MVAWDDVGGKVWAQPGRPTLENMRNSLGNHLAPLSQLARNLDPFSARLRSPDGATWQQRNAAKQASATLGVASRCVESKWLGITVFPCEDAVCKRNGTLIKAI